MRKIKFIVQYLYNYLILGKLHVLLPGFSENCKWWCIVIRVTWERAYHTVPFVYCNFVLFNLVLYYNLLVLGFFN